MCVYAYARKVQEGVFVVYFVIVLPTLHETAQVELKYFFISFVCVC